MKTILFAVALIAFMVAGAGQAVAGEGNKPLSEERQDLIEKNLINNLEHKSVEVRGDAIQTLNPPKTNYPEYEFDYAVLPLISKLKNDQREEIRILAALALYHFDSARGKFAISRRALYDNSPRVTRHCNTLLRTWNQKSVAPAFAVN